MTAKRKAERPKEKDWESLTPEKFDFESKGDTIEGVLIDAKEMSLGGMSYTIQVENKLFYFFGGRQIDSVLPTKVGYEVRVTYLGKAKTASGYNVKQFDVKFRKAPVVEPSGEEDVPF